MEWQLEHPDGTEIECETWLKGELEAGRVHAEQNTASSPAGKRVKITRDGSASKRAKR